METVKKHLIFAAKWVLVAALWLCAGMLLRGALAGT